MTAFLSRTRSFIRSEDGPAAVEYAVLLALIGVVVLAAATGLGEMVRDTFANIASRLPDGNG